MNHDGLLHGSRSKGLFWTVPTAILLGLMLLLPYPVQADIGPKPEMHFYFVFPGEQIPIAEGQLLECEDATCSQAKPLETLGPQSFICEEYECRSMAYSYAPYHKLRITLEDGSQLESNVFQKDAFSADYRVNVDPSGLAVQEFGLRQTFVCPALVTLVVELFVALTFLSVTRLPKRWLAWVFLANLMTLPVVWFLFPLSGLPNVVVMALSELFAFGFEAGFLYLITRRPKILLRQAITLSLAMNVVSFIFGLLIW